MPPLPVLSGDEFCRAVAKLGYSLDHLTSSHMTLRRPSGQRLSVPRHKELDRGTLRGLIRQAGLTVEEFVRLLWKLRVRQRRERIELYRSWADDDESHEAVGRTMRMAFEDGVL